MKEMKLRDSLAEREDTLLLIKKQLSDWINYDGELDSIIKIVERILE